LDDREGVDMPEDTAAHSQGDYDDRRIGQRLRHIRKSRKKTLRVLAGLVGVSHVHLSNIETGKTSLDSRKLIVALANALDVAPSDLTSLPIPAPANGNTDSSVKAVREALIVVAAGRPGGEVQPVEQLRHRYQAIVDGDFKYCGAALPGFMVDLHTTLAQGRQMAELLPLAVLLHTWTAVSWLYSASAPAGLRWQGALLASSAAQELNDPTWLGVSGRCASLVILGHGMFDQARQELDAIEVPTTSRQGMQLGGSLALCRSLVSAADGRPAESSAALEYAAELTSGTGEDDAFRLGFGPVNVGLWRMAAALECGEPDEAIRVAESLNPQKHPSLGRRTTYWMDYGRALTHVRRRDDAARALLRAEKLLPVRALRNSLTRGSLAELVAHSKDDALGRAIRRMAYRAGLPL
jgi:transcriptional regulator with XRE-family HTH domain